MSSHSVHSRHYYLVEDEQITAGLHYIAAPAWKWTDVTYPGIVLPLNFSGVILAGVE